MDLDLPSDLRLTASDAAVSTSLPGETIILDPRSSEYFSLTGAGAHAWTLLQAGTTLDDLVAGVTEAFDVAEDVCRRDLRALLGDLDRRGLLVRGAARS